jgi:hypothetical protein
MRHVPLRELGYAVGFLGILAAIYVGAFYALAEYGPPFEVDPPPIPERHRLVGVTYRVGGDFAERFFEPILMLDFRLRYPDQRASDGIMETTAPWHPHLRLAAIDSKLIL